MYGTSGSPEKFYNFPYQAKLRSCVSNLDSISFLVNGISVSSESGPRTPLLYFLRNDLKLKGTRFGCGEGMCGACTVLVEGEAALSCNTPLEAVAGKSVCTIEGVLADKTNPVLQRLLETAAWQCGYCTAGIVMKAIAILDNERKDGHSTGHSAGKSAGKSAVIGTRQELARELDANLCRCGAHPRILDALEPLLNTNNNTNNLET